MKLVSPGMPLVHPAVGRGARPALDALFHPKSIVVIGASEREGSVGRAVLENLRTFKGAVFAVNPSHASVLERPAYPSIAACPEVADLAITIVPAPAGTPIRISGEWHRP